MPHSFDSPVSSAEVSSDCNQDDIADETPPEVRFDRKAVKLETRGVTSDLIVPRQGLLFARETIWKESIVAKLDEVHRNELADMIRGCHTLKSVRQCRGCKAHSVFWNRCEVKWCPICAARLSRERRQAVEWWTAQIRQPKHVVLTVRNVEAITKEYLQWLKAAFSRLRATKFASNWVGGFYSMEVTNESRGWHVHFHVLVDARWIDSGELARKWAHYVEQDFAIVKVKDCRNADYLNEVTKYAVKGSDLSGWSATDIVAFIDAFEGVRTFGVFGSLYGKRTEWAEFLKQLHAGRVRCECGCSQWRILSEDEFEWEQVTRDNATGIPPPQPALTAPAQPELGFRLTIYPR